MHHAPIPALSPFWEASVAFHRHACPGLALGCRIAVDAMALLGGTGPSADEELVCVAETDSCAVDAIQAAAGCSLGKGNLLLRMRGKHAFSFFLRGEGRGMRFAWKSSLPGLSREERMARFLSAPAEELYTVAEPPYNVPEKALMSPSLACCRCGEPASEPHLRLVEGRPYCLDCHQPRSRVLF